MGKDLKGKDLGQGITQRTDKRYSARYTSGITGKRVEKIFTKLADARQWLKSAKDADDKGCTFDGKTITLNEWRTFWIDNLKSIEIRNTSIYQYNSMYGKHLKRTLGRMKVCEIKSVHIQGVVTGMLNDGYKRTTVNSVLVQLKSIFGYAVDNDIISKNPVNTSIKFSKKIKDEKTILTKQEQEAFVGACDGSYYSLVFRFILETGMRTGEVNGLRWEDIDYDNDVINVSHNMVWNTDKSRFEVHPPKSVAGVRQIPLTMQAKTILEEARKIKRTFYSMEYGNTVFCTPKGLPTSRMQYSRKLSEITSKIGVQGLTAHGLRHTFATRCIEAGMKPIMLQRILGHSSITVTMDMYVHVTGDEMSREIKKYEAYLLAE